MPSNLLILPKIGVGTWQLNSKTCAKTVLNALDIGYRLIDTAQFYRNEDGVGEAIDATYLSREEFLVATKVWITNLSPARLLKSVDQSLRKLHTPYLDLLYLHWPAAWFYKPAATWHALDSLVDAGKVRYLAVSNFSIALVEEALRFAKHPIVEKLLTL